ncbi:MAG: N-6 DNA methylase [Clostridia bacterium]|nr:N-6 DNA methylase [Clostridia bacterium]
MGKGTGNSRTKAGKPRHARRWGQFFTPERVAVFVWEMLQQVIPAAGFPHLRVIDPAAGKGVFLSTGIKLGLLAPQQVTGVEIDPALHPPAELKPRWFQADGLLDGGPAALSRGSFDLVVGNPPFGRSGKERLAAALAGGDWQKAGWLLAEGYDQKELACLLRLPVEALFLRRFLALCRPGGYGAIILPDGFLGNDRLQREREEFSRRARLLAVIGLPPGSFKSAGTPARASLVFFRRREENPVGGRATAEERKVAGERAAAAEREATAKCEAATVEREAAAEKEADKEREGEKETLFASTEFRGVKDPPAFFGTVLATARAYNSSGEKKAFPGVTWVKTSELPRRRWNPNYWDPVLRAALDGIVFPLRPLGEYIEDITYGPILPGRRPEPQENGVTVFGQKDLFFTGLNPRPALRVAAGGEFDPKRSRVRRGDLLFSRSGEGSLLRFRSGVYLETEPANVSCFVDRIRLCGIDPVFLWLFLMGKFGRAQILRLKNGVGTPNLNFTEIKSLRIPVVPEEVQEMAAGAYYRKILPLHRQWAGSVERSSPEYGLLEKKMAGLIEAVEAVLTTGMPLKVPE